MDHLNYFKFLVALVVHQKQQLFHQQNNKKQLNHLLQRSLYLHLHLHHLQQQWHNQNHLPRKLTNNHYNHHLNVRYIICKVYLEIMLICHMIILIDSSIFEWKFCIGSNVVSFYGQYSKCY